MDKSEIVNKFQNIINKRNFKILLIIFLCFTAFSFIIKTFEISYYDILKDLTIVKRFSGRIEGFNSEENLALLSDYMDETLVDAESLKIIKPKDYSVYLKEFKSSDNNNKKNDWKNVIAELLPYSPDLVVVSPDKKFIAMKDEYYPLQVIDIQKKEVIFKQFPLDMKELYQLTDLDEFSTSLKRHRYFYDAKSIVFSQDGTYLLSGGCSSSIPDKRSCKGMGELLVVSTKSWKPVLLIKHLPGHIKRITFNPDGDYLFLFFEDYKNRGTAVINFSTAMRLRHILKVAYFLDYAPFIIFHLIIYFVLIIFKYPKYGVILFITIIIIYLLKKKFNIKFNNSTGKKERINKRLISDKDLHFIFICSFCFLIGSIFFLIIFSPTKGTLSGPARLSCADFEKIKEGSKFTIQSVYLGKTTLEEYQQDGVNELFISTELKCGSKPVNLKDLRIDIVTNNFELKSMVLNETSEYSNMTNEKNDFHLRDKNKFNNYFIVTESKAFGISILLENENELSPISPGTKFLIRFYGDGEIKETKKIITLPNNYNNQRRRIYP